MSAEVSARIRRLPVDLQDRAEERAAILRETGVAPSWEEADAMAWELEVTHTRQLSLLGGYEP